MATATEVRFGAKGCVLVWDDGTQTTHEYETLRERLAALEGVPDPAAFVAAAREVVRATKPWVDSLAALDPVVLTEGEHARLAALRRLREVCNGK